MKQKKAHATHPVGNRTVIGIICIVVALAICFGIAPLVNRLSDGKTKIVRLTRDISAGATITEADIEEICTKRLSSHIFDMVNDIADKKQKQALELYYELLALKEPPMRILFLIARQFNLLLQVKELGGKGYQNKAIGEKVGLPGFIAGKYVTQASRFQREELRDAVEACVAAEEAIKTGKMNDNMSVELLIIKYSTK